MLLELLEFLIEIAPLLIGIGIVDRLNRQFAHPLEHRRYFVGGTFSRLNQGNRIPRIAHRLVKRLNLLRDSRGDGHPGGVILGGVNPLSGGQLLHCRGKRAAV